MPSATVTIALIVIAILLGLWIGLVRRGARATPAQLKPGQPLPAFEAKDEQGKTVQSTALHGAPAVILFVRGNWCPFCSAQVKNLTKHYRDITGLGAKLVLLTPQPLETTRRVASFFEVEFDFWLDDALVVTEQLGLLQKSGVPRDYEPEYGRDTVWPTALIVDAAGIIRYTELSKRVSDRPDPALLLHELQKTLKN